VITVGVGMGLGIALAKKHGIMGFVSGFGLVVVTSFTLLSVIRFICSFAKKKTKRNTSIRTP
jgi:hypothetical protein